MGVTQSIISLYKDAFLWFRMFIDMETYIADFNLMDKDSDGTLSIAEGKDRLCLLNWFF